MSGGLVFVHDFRLDASRCRASSTRQVLVADAAGGDLREVVMHLIREFRAGPTLREHLASLGR